MLDALDNQWETFSYLVRTTARFVIGDHEVDEASNLRSFTLEPSPTRQRRGAPHRQLRSFLEQLRHCVDGKMDLLDESPIGTKFHRGRLMNEPDGLTPSVKDLGPAPPDRASANRMSPAGIPMFYASADPQTAIAEIAGHGPEPYAMTGTFRNTRPLKMLDFTRRPAVPSYFDEAHHAEFGLAKFLDSFVRAITTPVIPDGRQHVESVSYTHLTLPTKRIV